MPQLSSGGGDDMGANDEMIAFKDEGEQEEKIQENAFTERDLADLKSSLVNESEISQSPGAAVARRGQQPEPRCYVEKHREHLNGVTKQQDGGMYKTSYPGYPFLMLPDPYLQSSSMPPSVSLRPNLNSTANTHKHIRVHRPQSQDISGFYSLPPGSVGQISPSMGWQGQPVYPGLPSCGFRQTYSSSLSASSSYPRFPHSLMLGPSGMHPTGIPHPAIVPPSAKQEHDHYDRGMYAKPQGEAKREKEPKKPVIKKPLNAFMLYMKEMRAKVIAECTLKESAAINQILGRRWHALTRDEQAKYYELARKERQLHMQLYPSWSARDNYGKKKRRKREKQQDSNTDPGSPKKCRARFGLNQQTDWCGPCRCVPETLSASPPPPCLCRFDRLPPPVLSSRPFIRPSVRLSDPVCMSLR
uniref:Transcription factor 7 n=1 Tax=Gadus morhua TaxID=8049 RepID=A0A8C5CT41_GADMO